MRPLATPFCRETPVVFLPSFIITHTYHPLYGRPRIVLCRRSGAVCAPHGREEARKKEDEHNPKSLFEKRHRHINRLRGTILFHSPSHPAHHRHFVMSNVTLLPDHMLCLPPSRPPSHLFSFIAIVGPPMRSSSPASSPASSAASALAAASCPFHEALMMSS